MAQIQKLIQENQKLKYQLEKFKSSNGLLPYIDDSAIKGGYHVVKNIVERDSIDCCHRKLGMKVLVIGEDLSFKEYVLKSSNCKENIWEEINLTVEENEVFLIEDYSELSENLTTQKELNLILKQLILNLQTQIDNIELTDEKVQITEDTDFAQIGQNQKDFNKNVSDYKTSSDLKNQEQDNRLNLVEQENQNQNTLISELRDDVTNLEGLNYTWSPTNRKLTLYDRLGTILSEVSLLSLDNEGTDIRYNATTLSLELYNADNELIDSIPVSDFVKNVGTQLQLNSNQLQLKDSQGNILSTVGFTISNIKGLQTALDSKLNKGSYPGNASDLKTEIDGKLNKPTTTSNTTSYPYVVGEDGNGNSARLPAGDLGKNFFNSDLSNTTARNHTMNAGVTVNTLGNPYGITGLPNKASDTTNFDNVVRYNLVTGQFGYGKAFVYNVPSTITVNHVNPPTVADPPTYVSEIQNRLTQLNSVDMQKFTTWNVVTHNNITNNNIRVTNNDTIYTFVDAFNSSQIPNETPVISINTEKVLPITSDWAIRFSTFVSHDGSKAVGNLGAIVAKRLIGLFTGNPTSIVAPILFIKDSAYDHVNKLLLGTKFIQGNSGANTSGAIYTGTNHNNVVQVTILKVNTVILFQVQYLGNTISEIYQASLIGENCGFTVSVVKPDNYFNNSVSVTSSIRYYIFP